MKTISKLALAAVAVLALLLPEPSQAQPFGPQTGYFFTGPLSIAGSATTNINMTIPLYRGRGFAMILDGSATDAASAAVTCTFKPGWINLNTTSPTNYILSPTLAWAPSISNASGTNEYTFYTNVPPTYLDNMGYIKLTTIANAHTNSITVSNLIFSIFP